MDLVGLDSDHILAFLDLLEHCDHRTDLIDALLKFGGKVRILFYFFLDRCFQARLESIRICFEARKVFGRRRVTTEFCFSQANKPLAFSNPISPMVLTSSFPASFAKGLRL